MEHQKVNRNKNVTQEDLESFFQNLIALEKLFIKESEIFLNIGRENSHIYTMDIFICAIVNRAISLMNGFITLANNNNYISAVPLIRLQVDNCLRFYAATLVKDHDDFFLKYLDDTHIRNIKDFKGNKMTDKYLVEKLNKEVFPGIYNLYVNTSGYIHFSKEHSFLQTEINSTENRKILTKIGQFDFFAIDQKVDFTYNMLKASEFLFTLTESWKFQKTKIEAKFSQ
ncbi:hypothetical protein ABID42_002523 [Arcicella rosea]|uniref:hypothetical protein n=1 Tax=Arcicella rosea TaxID=502909 RepID=UPI00345D1475